MGPPSDLISEKEWEAGEQDLTLVLLGAQP
jgi:hypothetical protein